MLLKFEIIGKIGQIY